jgi:hypothetical protein
VGIALVVGLFVTTKSTAMQSGFPVVAGNDEFETTGNGETHHEFAGTPIPADFFGAGSQPFTGTVMLEGVPLNPAASQTDTIIQRHTTVTGPGGSTQITMTALNLRSTSPIKVTYNNGSSEYWDVKVNLSSFKSSTGTMTINASSFDSTLQCWPKFTFTKVGGGGTGRVLDTGSGSGLTASSTAASQSAVDFNDGGGIVVDDPTPLPAPCKTAIVRNFEGFADSTTAAAAASSCAPLTFTATSPWFPCPPTGFCKPPLTEAERWARHNASPPGTKKQQQQAGGVAE